MEVVMKLLRRFRRLGAGPATAATLTLGLVVVALVFSSSAGAQGGPCADEQNAQAIDVPTGPATVSAASTPYGRVLVVGSGEHVGCSLYVLTSDQLHALTDQEYACGENVNPTPYLCDTYLWPALLTEGAPIAGPGVNPSLLGRVTRTDIPLHNEPAETPVQQVTYAGQPLYLFFLDETPGETDGANLFDPVTSPTGVWYLVEPSRGRIAPGSARLQLETAKLGGPTGPDTTVLAVSMNHGFEGLPDGLFPVYTFNGDSGHKSSCTGTCAVNWPPVLTSGRPEAAGPGVDEHALGIIVRPDGTHQVTYDGQPLYLDVDDAYIPGFPYNDGMATIHGGGGFSRVLLP
jgi:predicted lipoprotein with Yx(FWY)xxD motif